MNAYRLKPLDSNLLSRLRSFTGKNLLRIEIIKVMLKFLTDKDLSIVLDNFKALDLEFTGFLTTENIEIGYRSADIAMSLEEIRRIMTECDLNSNGRINYSEFVIATIDPAIINREDLLMAAFKSFDIVKFI